MSHITYVCDVIGWLMPCNQLYKTQLFIIEIHVFVLCVVPYNIRKFSDLHYGIALSYTPTKKSKYKIDLPLTLSVIIKSLSPLKKS